VLEHRDDALRLGYYFEALSGRYQAMFDVARYSLGLPQSRVQDWMDLDPRERAPWLQRADLRASAALLLLEQAALRRQQLLSRDELKRRFFRNDAGDRMGAADAIGSLQDVRRLENLFSRPAVLLAGTGYGLPQSEERTALAQEGDRRAAEWRQQTQWLRDEARRWLSEKRLAALDATDANVETLGERLRVLHREQGGLQLIDEG
jgi:hypothetical protein